MQKYVGIALLFVLPFLSGAEGCKCSTAKITGVELAKGYEKETGKIIEPTTTFAGTDRIHLIVKTKHVPRDTQVKVEWYAIEAGEFKDAKIHEASLTLDSSGNGIFTLWSSVPGGFPAGKYKAVVFLNDKQDREAAFFIQ